MKSDEPIHTRLPSIPAYAILLHCCPACNPDINRARLPDCLFSSSQPAFNSISTYLPANIIPSWWPTDLHSNFLSVWYMCAVRLASSLTPFLSTNQWRPYSFLSPLRESCFCAWLPSVQYHSRQHACTPTHLSTYKHSVFSSIYHPTEINSSRPWSQSFYPTALSMCHLTYLPPLSPLLYSPGVPTACDRNKRDELRTR